MGNWNQILSEINLSFDETRRKYLRDLHEKTGRNIVAYYSGWLEKTGDQFFNVVTINDGDKQGFMSCFYQLDKTKGLDLVIHSPGGRVTATESLVHYFRSIFADNIRVFVPQIAMSGGTLLALAGKEIWMGKHSNLGPIDPQFGNIPAVTLLKEVENALAQMKADPESALIWRPILSQIAPSFLTQAKQAIELSEHIAKTALCQGMFKTDADAVQKADKIAKFLSDNEAHKEHGRHIPAEDLISQGLNIKMLEDDPALQDAVLSVHHAFSITLSNTPAAKIIENHNGAAYVKNAG